MKHITRITAEQIVEFARINNALVEQREFKNFDRHVILTVDGTVSVKAPKDLTECTIEYFHGFNNKLNEINRQFKVIKIKGFNHEN